MKKNILLLVFLFFAFDLSAQELKVTIMNNIVVCVHNKDLEARVLDGDTIHGTNLAASKKYAYPKDSVSFGEWREKCNEWLIQRSKKIFGDNEEIKTLLETSNKDFSSKLLLCIYFDREGEIIGFAFVMSLDAYNTALEKELQKFYDRLQKEKIDFLDYVGFSEQRRYGVAYFKISMASDNEIKIE